MTLAPKVPGCGKRLETRRLYDAIEGKRFIINDFSRERSELP